MNVGLDVDATKNSGDDTEIELSEIQIVGRSVGDAEDLATEATEFSNE